MPWSVGSETITCSNPYEVELSDGTPACAHCQMMLGYFGRDVAELVMEQIGHIIRQAEAQGKTNGLIRLTVEGGLIHVEGVTPPWDEDRI